jgi:hypothetical protein
MAKDHLISFSKTAKIPGMILHHASANESDNGSPCHVVLLNNNKPDFWDVGRVVQTALNMVPDNVNLLPSEITKKGMFISFKTATKEDWDYPNSRNRHALAGGEDAYIDAIAPDDLPNVADKVLRSLLKQGVIGRNDYADAILQMHEVGLKPSEFLGSQGKATLYL